MRQRNTSQLDAIKLTIESSIHPLTAYGIYEETKRLLPSLSLATVYRALRSFLETGWLAAKEIPSHGTVYERSDLKHHHHFVCQECETVFDVPGCVGNLNKLLPPNFILENHEIILRGRCGECR